EFLNQALLDGLRQTLIVDLLLELLKRRLPRRWLRSRAGRAARWRFAGCGQRIPRRAAIIGVEEFIDERVVIGIRCVPADRLILRPPLAARWQLECHARRLVARQVTKCDLPNGRLSIA